MINNIRKLLTQSYILLDNNDDFAMIRAATFKEKYIDDDFLRLTKELAILKADLRENLNELSGVIEGIDGVVGEFKQLIERKQENIKNVKFKIN